MLLHGVGLALEAWSPQLETLALHACVIALDLPGHGHSKILDGEPTLPDYVQWLACILDDLQCGPVSLAGHSMGALIALGLAVERPDLLNRVALLNPVYKRSDAARAAVLARAEQIRGGDMEPSAPLSRWFDADEHESEAYQITAALLQRARPDGYAAAYGAFASGDAVYAERLADISCPLLALTADGDQNSTAEMATQLAYGVQNGRAVVIEGHRHMLNLTAPKVVNDTLLQWLETTA